MNIVINKCYGGFSLSHEGIMEYVKLKGITLYPWIDDISKKIYGGKATVGNPFVSCHYTLVPQEEYESIVDKEKEEPVGVGRFEKSNALYFSDGDIPRNDPSLVQVVRTLGKKANGPYADLGVVEIPDSIGYEIEEYDGIEWIAEKHRTWR